MTIADLGGSEEQKIVLKALRQVIHPKLQQDIVYSGHLKSVDIRGGGIVSVTLALDTEFRQLKQETMRVISALPQVTSVRVHMDNPHIQVHGDV